MKTKLLFIILAGSIACATTANTRVRVMPNEVDEALTQVNLDQYHPTPSNPDAPVDIRAIAGNDEARRLGAQGERMNRATRDNPIGSHDSTQHIFYGHWSGVCLNEPAINHIAASVNQVVRTTRADDFARLETLGANAVRDIRTLQIDNQTLRSVYQARINERDIALRESNNIIETLQRAQRNNFFLNIGLTIGGALVGAGTTALFVLLTQ